MKLEILPGNQFIRVAEATNLDLQQIQYSFTKKLDNWFILKKKNPYIPIEYCFFQTDFNIFPYGLWKELLGVVEKYNLTPVQIENGLDAFKDSSFDKQDFINWVDDYFKESDFKPRIYQIEAAIECLTYRFCTEEISTSGGKTLIAFMVFQYLFDRGKIKYFLYVCPNINLITQTEEKFYVYSETTGHKPNWKSECVFGGIKKKDQIKSNIVFASYQSLNRKDKEYFEPVDFILQDECLHPETNITMADGSLKQIKDVNVGDKVVTYNEEIKQKEINEVEFVYENLSKSHQMYELTLDDNTTIKITGNHKVLLSDHTWKRVDELNGDEDIVDLYN